ncbi:MAG: hypothetical protein MUF00_05015 [Gemmatimonadaceae bacterium]|nr:hypothetical protein [Gemmatimonadaceae bacterium]
MARIFLDELGFVCQGANAHTLAEINTFQDELVEARSRSVVGDASAPDVLSTSFGLVDEFATHVWDELVGEAYQSFRSLQSSRPHE